MLLRGIRVLGLFFLAAFFLRAAEAPSSSAARSTPTRPRPELKTEDREPRPEDGAASPVEKSPPPTEAVTPAPKVEEGAPKTEDPTPTPRPAGKPMTVPRLPRVEKPAPSSVSRSPSSDPEPAPDLLPAIGSVLEMQIELHRRGFSCGSIDGISGAQTVAALRAFQREAGVRDSGVLDDATRAVLLLTAPALREHVFTAEEIDALQPVPATWLEKSQRESLGYATALELAGERYRANPKLLQQLNPGLDWANVSAGVRIQVPAVERVTIRKGTARILIGLAAHTLEVLDADGAILAHFPVSIAKMVEKRPVGELHVKVIAPEPNYTFDPAVFPESPEAQELGRKLIIPPGPNNPVGRAWIGLDLTGYGIHGTPDPEKVGRTESHGCFRLANWDALTLLGLVRVGLPVLVEP